jgi:hypothetical protein
MTILSQESGWVWWVDALGFYADEEREGRLVFGTATGPAEPMWNPIRKQHEFKPQATLDVGIPDEGEITRHTVGSLSLPPGGERLVLPLE